MAFCIKCGRGLGPGAKFCQYCGQEAVPLEEEVSPELAPAIGRKLTPQQIESKVFRHIKRHHGRLYVAKCAKRLGVSETEVQNAAEALVAKGKLKEEK